MVWFLKRKPGLTTMMVIPRILVIPAWKGPCSGFMLGSVSSEGGSGGTGFWPVGRILCPILSIFNPWSRGSLRAFLYTRTVLGLNLLV